MSQTISKIFIQIIALLFAVFLWFNVVTKKNYEYTLILPVTEYEFPPGLGPVNDLPDSFEVKVSGQGKVLFRKDWKEAGLKVKATKLTRGIGNLELNPETVNLADGERVKLLALERLDPLVIRLDRIDTVSKSVASRLGVVPSHGYTIITPGIEIDPQQVDLIGPRALLVEIDSIQSASRIIDDADEDVSVLLALENPHPRSLRIIPSMVTISVPVDKIESRSFSGVPVRAQHSSGAAVILDPDRVTIDVTGPERLLDSLRRDDISVTIRRSGISADGYAAPEVTLPEMISLSAVRPDSVRVVPAP
jgi:YbbR domain-containing protein